MSQKIERNHKSASASLVKWFLLCCCICINELTAFLAKCSNSSVCLVQHSQQLSIYSERCSSEHITMDTDTYCIPKMNNWRNILPHDSDCVFIILVNKDDKNHQSDKADSTKIKKGPICSTSQETWNLHAGLLRRYKSG